MYVYIDFTPSHVHLQIVTALEWYLNLFQGRSQDFLKGGSSTSIELLEAGVWGRSPQPLRDFQYFNKSKLSKLLYFMQKVH